MMSNPERPKNKKEERYYESPELATLHFLSFLSRDYRDQLHQVVAELQKNKESIITSIETLKSVPNSKKKRAYEFFDREDFGQILKTLITNYVPKESSRYAAGYLRRKLKYDSDIRVSSRQFNLFLESIKILFAVLIFSDTSKYRAMYASYAAVIPFNEIPKELTKNLDSESSPNHVDESVEIILNPYKYSACSSAEPRLRTSMRNNKTIILGDDYLVMKFYGRPIALCTKTFTTKHGETFVAGNWYSPVGETRKQIKIDYENGVLRRSTIGPKWVLVREIRDDDITNVSAENLLNEARVYAASVSKKHLSEEENKARQNTNDHESMPDAA